MFDEFTNGSKVGNHVGAGAAAPVGDTMSVPVEAPADQQQGDPVDLPAPAFQVRDASTVSWVVRKVNEARAYARRVEAWSAAELRRAEHEERWLWRRFGRELEDWLRAELSARGGRRRSVALPGGTLGLRQDPARVVVADEAAALTWCNAHLSDAVKVRLEASGEAAAQLIAWHARHAPSVAVRLGVLVEPLRAYVGRTGELPPGVDVRPAADQLYVK